MPTIRYQDSEYGCQPGATVLESLNAGGAQIPSSCRTGVCQTCLMRATQGRPPARAQEGLKPSLREQGYFLACMCRPEESLQVALPGAEDVPSAKAVLLSKEMLNDEIARLTLECEIAAEARPGQFFNIKRSSDGLSRSYSASSVIFDSVELHVRRLPGGRMSEWLHEELKPGDMCELTGPHGSCFYTEGNADQPLLLIGTGSGLAPLRGVIQDALQRGHVGPISLYHGSWTRAGLYLVNELTDLAAGHSNFNYTPCIDEETDDRPIPGEHIGRADQAALNDHPDLTGYRVFLCGHPEMVKSAKRRAFIAGAGIADICADPFVLSAQD